MHEMFAGIMSLATKDARMMEQALAYVNGIRAKRRFKVLIEQPMVAEWLMSKPSTTADLVFYVQDEIHIFDLKTGAIPVQVYDNKQMLYYALTYGHLAPKAKGVYLHIVQPWADNIDVWFADTRTLGQFLTEAVRAELDISSGDTTLMPGDACMFCPANPHSRGAKGRPMCPAMMAVLYPEIIEVDEILTIGD
jgi:hypothetical protein